jgi:hypothetical protein
LLCETAMGCSSQIMKSNDTSKDCRRGLDMNSASVAIATRDSYRWGEVKSNRGRTATRQPSYRRREMFQRELNTRGRTKEAGWAQATVKQNRTKRVKGALRPSSQAFRGCHTRQWHRFLRYSTTYQIYNSSYSFA